VYQNNQIDEYDFSSTTLNAAYNRTITIPFNLGKGLTAENNLTLIGSDTGNTIYLIYIASTTADTSSLFSISSGRTIAGDMLLTTNNKLLLISFDGTSRYYLEQRSYPTGTLEIETELVTIAAPWAIYEYSSDIYIGSGDGKRYVINPVYPYPETYVGSLTGATSDSYGGASTDPLCNNVTLYPP
jgi:hypothetical protein